MKVSTTQPFGIVYSLLEHEYLGYLFGVFAVQINSKGQMTLQNQGVSSKNSQEFSTNLDQPDAQLIKLIDAIQPEAIVKKFYPKKIQTAEFFLKIYDKDKGDKVLRETIEEYVENKRSQIMEMLFEHHKKFFVMSSDGNPTWKPVIFAEEPATMRFHFKRNEENTLYYPTMKFKGQLLDFQFKKAIIIANEPAWMLLGDTLYHFDKNVDGNKLRPFLAKRSIFVPKKVEEVYYQKFIAPLIASFDVISDGFEIRNETLTSRAILSFSSLQKQEEGQLFESISAVQGSANEQGNILFELKFQYGTHTFRADDQRAVNVSVEKTPHSYIFHKVRKNLDHEKAALKKLQTSGLEFKNGKAILEKNKALQWLEANASHIQEENIEIQQRNPDGKRYFIGKSQIQVNIQENQDWFDVKAVIQFGSYEIPFIQIRKYILAGKTEFGLPNGEIAIIPETWFADYADLFQFSQENTENQNITLQKQHLYIINALNEERLAEVDMSEKLQKLKDFEKIEDFPLPAGVQGTLRPYQKAGYNWMRFLAEYKLGGCLADDMGLGKTVQTLTFLQYLKEKDTQTPSLVVVPTSLLYNWEKEAQKFAPKLKILNYTGANRLKNTSIFSYYDVVLTSYGIVRMDVDLLRNFVFNYVVLDEAQTIKNPTSFITKAVKELRCQNRLALTGTPIENTTLDLWSEMTFLNPGLLGTQSFFRKEFLNPIEKNQDETKLQKLQSIVKPFILRRNKQQVAKDLPPKIENICYCEMTTEQAELYEETKSKYRNLILEKIESHGVAKTQFLLLKGLVELRQISNHPRLIDKNSTIGSGKLEDVFHKLTMLLQEGKKVLIFSQFVKHLALVREFLDTQKWNYAYLDGSTRNRQEAVQKFQQNDQIPIFLISLKAGGLGLNLTAAEYVFLLDPWWNPAVEAQAIDRAHRIGQQQTVITYRFISRGTVEEKILNLQQSKQKLASDLITLEEGFVKTLSKEDITSLLT